MNCSGSRTLRATCCVWGRSSYNERMSKRRIWAARFSCSGRRACCNCRLVNLLTVGLACDEKAFRVDYSVALRSCVGRKFIRLSSVVAKVQRHNAIRWRFCEKLWILVFFVRFAEVVDHSQDVFGTVHNKRGERHNALQRKYWSRCRAIDENFEKARNASSYKILLPWLKKCWYSAKLFRRLCSSILSI